MANHGHIHGGNQFAHYGHGIQNGFHNNNSFHNHGYLQNGYHHGHHGNGSNYWRGSYGGYGWRYPYYGYGFGYGLGYGFGFGGLGYYGGYGYGGYGYRLGYGYGLNGYGYCLNGYGYGSPWRYSGLGLCGYVPNCAYLYSDPYGYPGYSNYSGYAGYGGSSLSMQTALAYAPQVSALAIAADASPAVVPSTALASQQTDTTSGATSGLPTAEQFARIGETAFKSRDYKGAVRAWRHGLVDDPDNAVLVLMLSQAFFATEQYSESAGAIQAAMQTMPEDKWNVVVKNFRDLYGKGEDYTTQIRGLEKAAREKPEDPSLRFLLGYHYGFLGYPQESVKQLEKCVNLAPRDEAAQKLLKLFEDKLPKKKIEPPTPGLAPDSGLQTNPAPLDFIPPPPLNPAPTAPNLTTATTEPASAATPANSTP